MVQTTANIENMIALWIFVALAGAGYAALFVPGFGPVDIDAFQKEWGAWSWLDELENLIS